MVVLTKIASTNRNIFTFNSDRGAINKQSLLTQAFYRFLLGLFTAPAICVYFKFWYFYT